MNRVAKFSKVSFDQFYNDYCGTFFDDCDKPSKESVREIYDQIKIPTRATKGSAGYDFFAPFDMSLTPGVEMKVPIQIVCGMARGADRLGERYAKEHGYQVIYFPADWDLDGKSAGFKRNVRMAEYADALVAFWDGESKGTKHMIEIAKEKGLDIRIKRYHIRRQE